MHLLKNANGAQRFVSMVVGYSAFHMLRQGVRSFRAEQFAILMCLLALDGVFLLAAWFSWAMMPAIAIIGTLPFALLTTGIIARIFGKL